MPLPRYLVAGVATLGILILSGATQAQDSYLEASPASYADENGCDLGCDDDCDPGCGRSFIADIEATFFRYHRSPGVQVGDDADQFAEFDHELAPRITLGIVNDEGLGGRIRWWDYNEDATAPAGGFVSVDTYTIDLEVFQNIQLNSCASVEFSGGVRYVDFTEMVGIGFISFNAFDGLGGVVGAKVRLESRFGTLYGGARFALIGDDKVFDDVDPGIDTHLDVITSMTEIGTGVEFNRCLSSGATLTGRAGFEWQIWENFVEGKDVGNDQFGDFFGGGGDAGFVGFVLGLALER